MIAKRLAIGSAVIAALAGMSGTSALGGNSASRYLAGAGGHLRGGSGGRYFANPRSASGIATHRTLVGGGYARTYTGGYGYRVSEPWPAHWGYGWGYPNEGFTAWGYPRYGSGMGYPHPGFPGTGPT